MEYAITYMDGKIHVKRYGVPLVYVGASEAVPGEKGLFADRDLSHGCRLGVFEGVPVSAHTKSNAIATLNIPGLGKVCVDGRTAGPPYLAMINDAINTPYENNAVIKSDGSVMILRDIPKNTEILMSYKNIMKTK